MPLLEGEAYFESLRKQQGRVGAFASLERARLLPQPTPRYSFGEQLGAAFRQENLFVNSIAPLFETTPVFEDDPDFDPEPFIGAYDQYRHLFPELERAGSLGELAAIKNRIDGELRDRGILEDMGFGRALAVYLPAGLLSPESFIPIGTAARTAGLVAKAGKAATKINVAKTAARVGTEGVVTQAIAETVLLQKQRFRTNEEAIANVVGAGLFSSIIGGAGASVGRTLQLGSEVVTDVVGKTNEIVAKELADPTSKLGLALDNFSDKQQSRKLHLEGGEDVLPKAVDDDFYGSDLTLEQEDSLAGAFLEAVESVSPRTAKIIGADRKLTRLVMKFAFTPSQRLARSKNPISNLINSTLDRQFLTTEGPKGPSVQSLVNLNEAIFTRKRMLANSVYEENSKLFRKSDISEDEYLELVGESVWRGGINDDTVFAKLADKPELAALIDKRADLHREISEVIFRTADSAGALSRLGLTPGRAESLLTALDAEYLARVIDQDYARLNIESFRKDVTRGLELRKEELLPEFRQEITALSSQAEAADNEAHKQFLLGQIAELQDALRKIDQDEFETTARSIVDNYLSRSPATGEVSSFQSSLIARSLKIDERFIRPYMIKNVAELEARLARSVLPDLTMSDFFQRQSDPRGRMQSLKERLDASRKTVNGLFERGVTPKEAEAVVRDLQDLADEAQAVLLGHSIRLSRNLEEVGIDNIARFMGEMDEAIEIRSEARRSIQSMQESRRGLARSLKALERQEVSPLVDRKDRRT